MGSGNGDVPLRSAEPETRSILGTRSYRHALKEFRT
jgi:hypothetical protein